MTNETIGQRLRRLRKERGMAQRELTGPGVSHAYVSRIEADLRTPSVKAIRKLAAKLGVSPDYLERGLDVDVAEERELKVLELRAGAAIRRGRRGDRASPVGDRGRGGEGRRYAWTGESAGRPRQLALAHGDHEQALRSFEQALVSGEISAASDLQVFIDTAICYREVGRTERAEALLRHAIERLEVEAPGSASLRATLELALALTLIDLDRDAEAADLARWSSPGAGGRERPGADDSLTVGSGAFRLGYQPARRGAEEDAQGGGAGRGDERAPDR